MFSVPDLKDRGWTATAIKKFLGEPDETRPNPYYKSAAPMKFFKKTRVYGKERSKDFKAWREKSETRKVAAQKAVATKEENLIKRIENFKVEVIVIENVEEKACDHYNERNEDKIIELDWEMATPYSDDCFLQRITVNYIRHELTDYDYEAFALAGKVGKTSAFKELLKKIYQAIADAYPKYKKEAIDQCDSRVSEL